MNNEQGTTRITLKEVKNGSDKLLIRAMNLITDPTNQQMSWSSHLFMDQDNETDINPVNFILFSDCDITNLVTWYQGLADREYKLRRYTLSLVLGCHVDGEAMASFLHLVSEDAFHPREAALFSEGVFDMFYNDYSIISAFAAKRERYVLDALRLNDLHEPLPSEVYVLGVAFNVTELQESDSSSEYSTDDSTSSSHSVASSIDFSDREERIAELIAYLREDSSGYGSM